MTIREALQKIIGQTVRDPIYYGKVKPGSVSGGFCTIIDANDETHEFLAVRLQADPENGQLFIPADNSLVVIMEVNPFDYAVVLYSAVTSIKWLDGSYGGLARVIDLTSKLNRLENKVNDFLTAYATHVHTGVTTGGGSSGPPAVGPPASISPLTVREDIENTNITHGNP